MSSKNDEIILSLLQEVREDQKKDSKKIQKTEACVNNMQSELQDVKRETKLNTKHLGEHMSRTEIAEQSLSILKDLHQDNQKRIEIMESDLKKKDEAIVILQTKHQVEEKINSWFQDNLKYWLTITGLMVGLVTKIIGLW